MGLAERWRTEARWLKGEVYVLYLAYRGPRVPWYAKVVAAGIVAYAFSPIDFIPDFIPILGYLDDLVLLPLSVLLICRMIPEAVWRTVASEPKPPSAKANRSAAWAPRSSSHSGWSSR